ncbi:HprK-related kinase A [Vibrio ziniensis]|uniref:HprK-related kinase A n=1 Tax=Vibrio ziniensis TaxID=2711221 RepID=A0A6G7CMN9_9VIBR|nr:HprK-related kinase A [Vibrio ziniensis]QIH43316.1 HprK-related kinase A [Vibrio ziniensis]
MTIIKEYHVAVGPFIFSVHSDISALHYYLEKHYKHCLLDITEEHFVDYYIEVMQGRWYRRLYKPQAIFKFNYYAPFKPLPLNQAHALLEWGMNWVIASQAHQYFILHAATVAKGDQGVIISAPSGSGKSTLCAYLVSQGWTLLSDELALIDPDSMQLYGLERPISLKNQSIELLKDYFSHEKFSKVIKDTQKGNISLLEPVPNNVIGSNTPIKPSHIVFIKYNPNENCYSESVEPALALTEIIRNSFNFNVLDKAGFACARKLVALTPVSYIEYNNFQLCEREILEVINSAKEDKLAYAN